jgi:hypothetical protein
MKESANAFPHLSPNRNGALPGALPLNPEISLRWLPGCFFPALAITSSFSKAQSRLVRLVSRQAALVPDIADRMPGRDEPWII